MTDATAEKLAIRSDTPNFTIREITGIYERFLETLENSNELRLDIDDAAHVDLSFLQLIESARRYAEEHNKSLQLIRPAGDKLRAVLDRAGLLAKPSPEFLRFWFHTGVAA